MLDQLFNIVKGFGKETVVENPEVPNEINNDVMAEATNTVAGGLKNVMAGGGIENIVSLFQGGGGQSSGGGLLKNPMVTMMIGHLISKLTNKYNMSPASASNVASNLVPNVLNDLIQKTQDPNNSNFTLDKLIGSLTGGGEASVAQQTGGFNFQDLISNFTGGGGTSGGKGRDGGAGFDLQDIFNKVTNSARNNTGGSNSGGGGLMEMIKGFIK